MRPDKAITVMTQVLVRMELDHVVEWLTHLRKLGIGRVWIIYEHATVDTRCGQSEPSSSWKKKPEANFHLELDDDDAISLFRERVASVSGLEVLLRPVTSTATTNGARQAEHLTSLLVELHNAGFTGWVGCIDVDELVVAPSGLARVLAAAAARDGAVVEMKQRVMGSRWLDGQARPMTAIGQQFGVVGFNRKLFVRPSRLLVDHLDSHPIRNVHGVAPDLFSGTRTTSSPGDLCYHHFRGIPTFLPEDAFPNLKKYAELGDRSAQPLNFDHVTQFTLRSRLRSLARRISRSLR